MKSFTFSSISKKLAILVILAVLPALLILLYTGLEQRKQSIKSARQDIQLLAHTMAKVQEDLTRSSKQILSTLALLPEVQNMDTRACSEIFKAVLQQNPGYQNITLTDLSGMVLASGLPFKAISLTDRKHVREALTKREFSAGEYIVTRLGVENPAFAYAFPVVGVDGNPLSLLTISVRLDHFSSYYDLSELPDRSFVAVTDHLGIRLFYYPPKKNTNPVGKPIHKASWEKAANAESAGMFSGVGSDGIERIFAFESLRLTEESKPYIYLWVGTPEDYIYKPAVDSLIRNLLFMLFCATIALIIAWLIGKNTLLRPIEDLVALTKSFAGGNLPIRSEIASENNEFGMLTRAFHDMADTLVLNKKSLEENEARFRLVMDSLDSIVYVADMNTYEILFINAYGKKQFGDVVGQLCWKSIQQGQSRPCSFCTNKYLLDHKGDSTGVYSWEMRNTITDKWYYMRDRAIQWLDGRMVRLEVATDITQRKETENRLAVETERLAVTLRSIGDGVITTDVKGHIILINAVAEKLTGWKSSEAAGQPLFEVFNIIDELSRESCQNPVEKILASGENVELVNHTLLISKNGQERNIADSGAPIRDKNGVTIGIVLVFRDITSELRTEQELIKVKKLESIGVLAGGIAHDFNNILVGILGNIDLALLDSGLKEKTREYLQDSLKASYRARNLTQQLLTFARGGDPIKETSSLADIVRESANFILRGDKVSCHFHFSEDLHLVDIDKGQISQVVQNIILNGSQAMPEGGIIRVSCENISSAQFPEIATRFSGEVVKMVIKDCGVGIPSNMVEKIFDPYFSTKKEGSGLGLAISHSIVQKHNGHIFVQSTPGVGTAFTIYLPASPSEIEPDLTVNEGEKIARNCRILVMDDEEMVRGVIEKMLAQEGHEILLAVDGLEAIELYRDSIRRDQPIDLAIMDLTIPGGMGGAEAAKLIQALDPQTIIVVSSGYSNDPVMANFKEHGFSSSISKPYKWEKLKRVINELLE